MIALLVVVATSEAASLGDQLALELKGEPWEVGGPFDPWVAANGGGLDLTAPVTARAVLRSPSGVERIADVVLAPEYGDLEGCDPIPEAPDICDNRVPPIVGPFVATSFRFADESYPRFGPLTEPGTWTLRLDLPDGGNVGPVRIDVERDLEAPPALPVRGWEMYAERRRETDIQGLRGTEWCWKKSDTVTFCLLHTDPLTREHRARWKMLAYGWKGGWKGDQFVRDEQHAGVFWMAKDGSAVRLQGAYDAQIRAAVERTWTPAPAKLPPTDIP
jgi:hypothetical protein